jgi:ATP-dependent DNA helicase RecG
MNTEKLKQIFAIGETVAVEFKQCSNSIESDTYETVCSFLNRFGGNIFLGVNDNGFVYDLSAKAAPELINNFISMISNPDVISPTVYLSPEIIEYEGQTIIRIHVPQSSEVHRYKKIIYDRVNDSDVKVTATGQIAQMYIRKQRIGNSCEYVDTS